MGKKARDFYKRSKWAKKISLIVLAAFIVSVTSMIALSASTPDMLIVYKNESWNVSKTMNYKWYFNKSDAKDNNVVSFTVDLSSDYGNYKKICEQKGVSVDDPGNSPFTVKASINGNELNNITILPQTPESFTGKYNVNVELPEGCGDGSIETVVSIKQDNSWSIPSPFVKTFSIVKDTQLPTIVNPNVYSKPGFVDFEFSSLQDVSEAILVDNNGSTIGLPLRMINNKITIDLSNTQGTQKVNFKITDFAGNSEILTATVNVLSAISGDFTFQCTPASGSNTNSTKLQITANNTINYFDEGRSYAEISVNGVSTVIKVSEWPTGLSDIPLNQDGIYTVKFFVFDLAGNTFSSEPSQTFTIDKTAPAIEPVGINDTSKLQYCSIPDLGFNFIDANLKNTTMIISKKGIDTPESINMDTKTSWSRTFDEGEYSIEVVSVDYADNSTSKTYNFVVDKTDPIIKVTGIKDIDSYQYFSANVIVNFSFTDEYLKNTKIVITEYGKDMPVTEDIGTRTEWSKEFDEGEFKLDIISMDESGRSVSKTYYIVVDKNNPTISVEGIEDKEEMQYFKDDVLVKLSFKDSSLKNTTIEITKKGETNADIKDIGKAIEWSNTFGSGEYNIQVTSIDKSGHTTTKNYNIVVDKTSPQVQVSGIEDKSDYQYFQDNVILGLDITDEYLKDTIIKIKKIGEEGETTENIGLNTKWSREFGVGEYRVEILASDLSGGITSKTYIIVVDKSNPVISVIGGIEDKAGYQYYQDRVTVSLSISDEYLSNSTIKITKKGEDNQEVLNIGTDTKWQKEFDEGEYNIEVISSDKSGRETRKAFIVVVDKENPVISIGGIEDKNDMQYFNTNVDISLSLADKYLKETIIRVIKKGEPEPIVENIGGRTNWSREFDVGEYKIEITSTDRSGRKTIKNINFVVDKKAPVIASPTGIKNDRNRVELGLSITDDYMNYSKTSILVQVLMKDGSKKEYNILPESGSSWSNFKHAFSEEGNYTIKINSTDMSGNRANEVVRSFIIDRTRPDMILEGFGDREENNKQRTEIIVSIKDLNFVSNGTSLSITKDGSRYTRIAQPGSREEWSNFKFNLYEEGTYVVSLVSRDILGNESSETRTLVIDRTAPVITPKFKGESRIIKNNEYIKDLFTPEFVLDRPEVDNIGSVILNGREVRGRIPVSSSEMVYTYRVVASDKAGNSTILNLVYTVDFTRPELKITDIVNGYFKNNLAPKVEYSDTNLDESKVSITLNGQPFVSGTVLEKEQDYVLKAVVGDLAGNVSSQTVVFTLDKTAPVIKFTEDISGKYLNTEFIPDFIIKDMVEYDIINMTLNGEKYEKGTPITQDGKYVLFVEAKDKSGNISGITIEFILDKTPPKVIYSGAKPNGKYYETINLVIGLDNSIDKIKSVKINGELFNGELVEENGQKVIKTVLTEVKDYFIEVTAEDAAGNITTDKLSFKIAEKNIF